VEQDPSLRLAATWIPGASTPPVVHGANTWVTVEEEVLVGAAVVLVVVGAVVVVLTVPTGGSVVVVVGADVLGAAGSLVVVVVVDVAPDNCGLVEIAAAVWDLVPVSSLVLVGDFDEPLVEDVDVGATVDDGAVDMPEGSAPLAFGVDVVVVPPVIGAPEVVEAGPGAPGSEPGSNAISKKITTMTKPDVIPIPFCRCRIFTFFISCRTF
jgi:hypothetical protein